MEYIDKNKLEKNIESYFDQITPSIFPGCEILVFQNNKEVFYSERGYSDFESKKNIRRDNIFRIFSMTKAIVCTSILILIDKGKLQLQDPVEKFIPEWKDLKVFQSGDRECIKTNNPERKMLIKDLMTHTSGLTYPFTDNTIVNQLYGEELWFNPKNYKMDSKEIVDKLSGLPLLFSPGEFWSYSISTDILGIIIERISDNSLSEFLNVNIFIPLGMKDSGFSVPHSKKIRLTSLYSKTENGYQVVEKGGNSTYLKDPSFYSGGGGGVSTIDDYMKFCSFLLSNGTFEGKKFLSENSMKLLLSNQLKLPITDLLRPRPDGMNLSGYGHGLGGALVLEPKDSLIPYSNKGEFFWFGAACTMFFVDPKEKIAMIFMTQMMNFIFGKEGAKILEDIKTIVHKSKF